MIPLSWLEYSHTRVAAGQAAMDSVKESLNMKTWLWCSLATIGLWGVWGFLAKTASRSMTPANLFLLGSFGNLLVFPVFMILYGKDFRFPWTSLDHYSAVLAGIFGAVGTVLFYVAVAKGEVSRVMVMTAMYPGITVVLAHLLLHEPVTTHKLIGLAMSLIGVILLSY